MMWLRRLWRRLAGEHRENDHALVPHIEQDQAGRAQAGRDWMLVESVGSAAMGSLYQQVLREAGIPVLAREWGGGSALIGGVPVGVSLFVPRDRLAAARAALGRDDMKSEDAGRGTEGGEHDG
jgi:hypothetical protein